MAARSVGVAATLARIRIPRGSPSQPPHTQRGLARGAPPTGRSNASSPPLPRPLHCRRYYATMPDSSQDAAAPRPAVPDAGAAVGLPPVTAGFSDHVFAVEEGVELPLRFWSGGDGRRPWLIWFHGGACGVQQLCMCADAPCRRVRRRKVVHTACLDRARLHRARIPRRLGRVPPRA